MIKYSLKSISITVLIFTSLILGMIHTPVYTYVVLSIATGIGVMFLVHMMISDALEERKTKKK